MPSRTASTPRPRRSPPAFPATPVQYSTGATHAAGVTRQCHAVSQAPAHRLADQPKWRRAWNSASDCNTTLDYSHLVRAFKQNDQQVFNLYRYSAARHRQRDGQLGLRSARPRRRGDGTGLTAMAGYNIVPDNQTQIDRLKFCTKIGCDTDVYLLGYVGYNEDLLRDTYRNFNGADLRITNTSIEHAGS